MKLGNFELIVELREYLRDQLATSYLSNYSLEEKTDQIKVIDFKGSTRPKDARDIQNYFLQATAYCLMWQERTGEKIKDFSIFLASEEGLMQVFSEKTVNFVGDLKKTIEKFKEVSNDSIET